MLSDHSKTPHTSSERLARQRSKTMLDVPYCCEKRTEAGNYQVGGLEHGEDPRQALTREVAEETGMTVEWMSKEPVAFKYVNDPHALFPAAQKGSLCSQIYLQSIGVDWLDAE